MGAWPSLQQRLEDVWRVWPPKMIFRDVYLLFYFFALFIWLCQVLAVARCLFSCSHAGSSSLTRDQTWAPYAGNMESQPLDHQEVWDVCLRVCSPVHSPQSEVKVAQSCLTLCDPMDHTVHGILQARILDWVSLSLLPAIFPIQRWNPGLPPCRRILYQLSHKGSPHGP